MKQEDENKKLTATAELDALEKAADEKRAGENRETTFWSRWKNQLIALMVVGLVLIIAISIGVSASSDGESAAEDPREQQRIEARQKLKESAVIETIVGTSVTIAIRDADIGLLPNDAFQFLDLPNLTDDLFIDLSNCNINEVEANAFVDQRFQQVGDDKKISLSLAGNKLEALPIDTFKPFLNKTLDSLNLSDNKFDTLENSAQLLTGHKLSRINLDGNPLEVLAEFSNIDFPRAGLIISCIGCNSLENINEAYCNALPPEARSTEVSSVDLLLRDTLISQQLSQSDVADLTGCLDETIQFTVEEEEKMILRIEARERIQEAANVFFNGGTLRIELKDSDIRLLPHDAFRIVDIPPPKNGDYFITLLRCNISEVESNAFTDQRFQQIGGGIKILITLDGNNLASLPNDTFKPFLNKRLFTVRLANNEFETLENSLELFEGHRLREIDLDGNPLSIMPPLRNINLPSDLILSCNGCSVLEDIDEDYCESLLPISGRESVESVKLGLRDTVLAQLFNTTELADLTGCLPERITI